MDLIKKIKRWLPALLLYIPFKIFSIINRKKKDVLLFGTGTGLYHDNSKYLYEFYIEKKVPYNLYWVAKNKNVYKKLKDSSQKVVLRNSIFNAYLASRAKTYFITAEILDVFYFINAKTKLIQLWHGTPIKKIEFDYPPDIKRLLRKEKWMGKNHTSSRFDKIIIEDEKFIPIFKSAFRIDEEKIEVLGQIRNSLLINPKFEKIKFLKEQLNLSNYERILIYIPTFRENYNDNITLLGKLLNKNAINFLIKNDIVLLIKLHPLLLKKIKNLSKEFYNNININNVMDISWYDDIQELLIISDIMITDYSSVAFDYMLLNRPIYLFQPDLEEYKRKRDGFYNTFDFLLNIGKVINSVDEINHNILQCNYQRKNKMNLMKYLKII